MAQYHLKIFRNRFSIRIVSTLLLCSFLLYSLISCNDDEVSRNKSHANTPTASIKKGKILAATYCQSCHLLPDPALLNSKSWERGVLPQMGPRLGIFSFNYRTYPSSKHDYGLDSNYYPSHPLLRLDEWKAIIDYYGATSPDTLPNNQRNRQPIKTGLSLFSVQKANFSYATPGVSLVKIDTSNSRHQLIVSDAIKLTTYRFDKGLRLIDSIHIPGAITDLEIDKNTWLACNTGVLNPNNSKYGSGQYIQTGKDGKLKKKATTIFSELQRPVQLTTADLNGDGKKDYLVCEFGFLQGALSWMENKGNEKFERHVLRRLPGAIKAYVQDYNRDGLPDIWVLFAQGEEGVFLFTNKGDGQFSQQELLRFPPVYGSSYFELDDFNKDGYPDILYTCGDNADYSPVLKPYHGVYIFINDKTNHFKQQYFFPINGCFKAIAQDYDGDGDLDIAAISNFADYLHHPEEGFVYLENKGNFRFDASTLPETQQGKWLTMDAGDLDGDGKIDLVLGNFSIGPVWLKSTFDWRKGPPFLVLKNTGAN